MSWWMMVGAIRMQVSVSSRREVKIVIALFMRGRSELPEELWRVGAKMVTASVNRREPSSLLKATKAAIPMTMTTARAMGPNAK